MHTSTPWEGTFILSFCKKLSFERGLFVIPRVILSEGLLANRSRTFSTETPNTASQYSILGSSDFDCAQGDTVEKAQGGTPKRNLRGISKRNP